MTYTLEQLSSDIKAALKADSGKGGKQAVCKLVSRVLLDKAHGVQISVGNHFMNNPYAITKATAERFALMYNKEHGTKIAVVRGLKVMGECAKAQRDRFLLP